MSTVRYTSMLRAPLDALSDVREIGAVALIMMRAHDARWAPVRVTVAELVTLGLTEYRARAVIALLTSEGVGERASRSEIRLRDPHEAHPRYLGETSEKDPRNLRGTSAAYPEPTPEISEQPRRNLGETSEKDPRYLGETSEAIAKDTGDPAVSEPLKPDTMKQETVRHEIALRASEPPAGVAGDLGDLLAIAARYSLEMQLLSMGSSLSPRECGAIGAALRKGLIPQELDSFVAWVLESGEDDARWLRDKSLTWSSLTRSDRWVVWLRSALAWEDRGRCDYQKPTAKQEKTEAFKASLGDALDREKRRATAFDGLFTEVKGG